MKNLSAIILLFIANTISGVAQGISMISIPWYFAEQGDMSRFGLIYILTNVGMLFWAPYSGLLVDRYNRKHLFLGITLVCGTLLSMIAYRGFVGEGLAWFWVALVFMMTFFNYNIHYPTLYAFVQEISEPRYYGKLTSYIEIQGQVSSMMAGAGAAFLLEGSGGESWTFLGWTLPFGWRIAAWEIHEIFAMDAATYFVALGIIALISFEALVHREVENTSIRTQLSMGYRYLRQHTNIFIFGVASYSNFVATLILSFFVLAIYVNQQLEAGGDVYAISEVFYAFGAVFAGLAIRRIFQPFTIPQAIIFLTLLGGGLCALMTFNSSVFLLYVVLLLFGIANAGTRILRITYLFQQIPNQVYGRANSIFFLTNITFRILFLSLFSLAFFQQDQHIVYATALLSLFLLASAAVLLRYYPRFA